MVAGGSKVRVLDTLTDYLNAYVSSSVSPTTSGVGIGFTKQGSNGGNIDLAPSGYGFIAPRDGLYLLSFFDRTDRDVFTGEIVMQWRQNAGGSISGGSQEWVNYLNVASSNGGNFSPGFSTVAWLDEDDTLETWVTSSSGTVTDFLVGGAGYSRLTVIRFPGTPLLS